MNAAMNPAASAGPNFPAAERLSDAARRMLERYLYELRVLLRGCASVDPAEVEAEVRQHIDRELSETAPTAAPVSGEQLGAILNRLGSPTQWVPIEELPLWRRVVVRLRMGPTSTRWALWIFALFVLGLLLLPVGVGAVLLVATFLLARALLAMSDETGEAIGWRRWLVYPPLVVVYLPLLVVICWPAFFPAAMTSELRHLAPGDVMLRGRVNNPATVLFCGAVGVGLWLMVVSIVLLIWPALPAHVFRPFARVVRRRTAALVLLLGVVMCAAGTVSLAAWLL